MSYPKITNDDFFSPQVPDFLPHCVAGRIVDRDILSTCLRQVESQESLRLSDGQRLTLLKYFLSDERSAAVNGLKLIPTMRPTTNGNQCNISTVQTDGQLLSIEIVFDYILYHICTHSVVFIKISG